MPRRNNNSSGRRRRAPRSAALTANSMAARTKITISGSCLLGATVVAGGAAYTDLCPQNLSTRLDDLRSCFTSYRFVALSLTWGSPSAAVDTAVAYYGSAPTASPSTLAGVVEAACSSFHPVNKLTQSTLRIPRTVLFENDYRWWRTTGSLEPYQGRVYIGFSGAGSILMNVKYVIEFCGPTYSSSSSNVLHTPFRSSDEKDDSTNSTSEEPEIITHGESQHPSFGPNPGVARDVPRSASGPPARRSSSYDRGYPPLR